MRRLIAAVEQLRMLPGAIVDGNFRQGRAVVFTQLRRRWAEAGTLHTVDEAEVDLQINGTQKSLHQLTDKVAPYTLPFDYIFFHEYYGGLAVQTETFRFEIHGCGPMTNDWYGDWVGDNWGEYVDPLLPGPRGLIIGYLRLDARLSPEKSRDRDATTEVAASPFDEPWYPAIESDWIEFRLDLAGMVQQHSIVGLGPNDGERPHPLSLGSEDQRAWRLIAPSFTAWIERAVETDAQFGYTKV
jgi:hypothetical protein